MQFILFLIIAFAPSLIWLFYFLRKDPHPEPRRKILKVFTWGMLAAFPAVILEEGFMCLFSSGYGTQDLLFTCPQTIFTNLIQNQFILSIVIIFIGIALVEETLKFLAAHNQISKDKAFDEPVDALVYLIVAGLGFATAENLLIIYSSFVKLSAALPSDILGLVPLNAELGKLAIIRFLGATLLHALLGGLMGFFYAYAILLPKKRYLLILGGLASVTMLHGIFNLGIIELQNRYGGLLAAGVIIFLAILMPSLFKKVRALHAECKIENTSIVPKIF